MRRWVAVLLGTVLLLTGTAPLAHAGKGWTPFYKRDGVVHRWEKCTLTYKVAFNGVPKNAARPLHTAVRDIERVTGVDFVYWGAVKRRISAKYTSTHSTRTRVNADILITMRGPSRSRTLAEASNFVTGTGFANGWITVRQKVRNRSFARQRSVYQHELGHILGLGHVRSRRDVMHPEAHGFLNTQGWRAGLRTLYRRC